MTNTSLPQGQDIESLAHELRAAARAYYDTSDELMTDAEYDQSLALLEAATANDPAARAQVADLLDRVAAGQSTGGDVTHPVPMGSLDKTKSLPDVETFVAQVRGAVCVEPKLDGLAVRAVYEGGTLTQVVTRGDGLTGEDITARALALSILPGTVERSLFPGRIEVRGEVFMQDADFAPANARRDALGATPFVNQRNAAAGILRKGDPEYAGLLTFAAYDLIDEADASGSHSERMWRLEQSGALATARSLAPWLASGMQVEGSEQVRQQAVGRAIDMLGARRADLGFPIDGVVIKADTDADRALLGEGSRAPRWATAFKYPAESATTRVAAITTAVGRTGRLAIRIEVDPVFVGGTTVTFATGHNVAWMAERDVRVGDTVQVRRAGDVIPYVEQVDLDLRPADSVPWAPPATDPAGGQWDKSTLLWRSTDPTLSAGAAILYAASRDALDIEGLGTEIVDALVERGAAQWHELFSIEAADLADLELAQGRRLGEKNAVKIVAEIDKARSAPWARVITALGLRMTGRTMSRRLAAAFPTMDALIGADAWALAEVDGVGAVKAAVIREGLDALVARGVPAALAACGVNMGAERAASGEVGPLDGLTIVVSGSVPGYSRTTVAEAIEAAGGRASSSVSAATSLLVSEPSTSSKYVKAESLGVRIVTPSELLGMLR